MIDILKDVLCASGYNDTDEMVLNYEEQEYLLSILRNSTMKSQAYIVINLTEEQLLKISIKDDFFSEVFTIFRGSQLYDSDMDKNTSLVFCVNRALFFEKLRRKMVEIEDDPYYFKKYVFSYSLKEEKDFRELVKQDGGSPINLIEKYIFNKNHFTEFKGNVANNNMYRLISDLIIKIPVIPIRFDIDDAKIHNVDYYLEKTKTFKECNVQKLEQIVEILISEAEEDHDKQIDQIIKNWE